MVGTCTELGPDAEAWIPRLGAAKGMVCAWGTGKAPRSCVPCSPSFVRFWWGAPVTVSRRNAPAEPCTEWASPHPSQSPGLINTEIGRVQKGSEEGILAFCCVLYPPPLCSNNISRDSVLRFLVDGLTPHLKIQTVCRRDCVLPNICQMSRSVTRIHKELVKD